jgi:uroporphyrinogen-III synthase
MAVPSGPAVVLTREPEDNLALARELESRGVPVREIPCMATRWRDPGEYPEGAAAVVFTSRRGVKGLRLLPLHARIFSGEPGGPLICAVGKATAEQLRECGFHPDIVADPPSGLALARALSARLPRGGSVVLVRGNLRAGEIDRELELAGFTLLPLVVYENVDPDVPVMTPFPVAAVFAAAPSAARRLLAANPWLREAPFVAIGDVTEKAVRDLGVTSVAAVGPGLDDLVEALWGAFKAAGKADSRGRLGIEPPGG